MLFDSLPGPRAGGFLARSQLTTGFVSTLLPFAASERRSRPQASSGVTENADEQPLSSEPRLLIVEDDYFILLDIEAALQRGRFEIVGTATSAAEAIEAAGRMRPDLVLMDIRLRGERDGIDAAIEIRRRYGIACVFATAFSDAALRARAAEAEPLGWLIKPYTSEQLLAAIDSAITRDED